MRAFFDIERIESRTLLSVEPIVLRGNFLTLNGNPGADVISARTTANGSVEAKVNGHTRLFTAEIRNIEVNAGNGVNTVNIAVQNCSSVVFGGTGRDNVTITRARSIGVSTGDGNDVISVVSQRGGGIASGRGDDIVTADINGRNLYRYGVSLGSGNDRFTGGRAIDDVSGDNGNDTLIGNGAKDRLEGDAGDDLLIGGDLADILDGASGNDTLDGGGGRDGMKGGSGDDVYLARDGEADSIQEVGGTFYGIDRAEVDLGLDFFDVRSMESLI